MNQLKSSILTAFLGLLAVASAQATNLTVGNLIVERFGNGSTTLSNAAFDTGVLEYTTSGTLIQTISFPSTGSSQSTDSGTATSNGYLNSYNGLVAVPGNNVSAGTASVTGLNNKLVSILDNTGTVVTRTLFPTGGPTGTPVSPFSGNNFRSAIATGNNTFYASGTSTGTPNTGGVWYNDGTSFTQVSTSVTNTRNLEIFNNQLYVASGSSGFLGINKVGTGLPTGSGETITNIINMGTGASPYGFVMFDTNNDSLLDTAFIADDRTTNDGGLHKWSFNGTAWVSSYSLLFDAAAGSLSDNAATGFAGIRGLTGSYDSVTGFSLFATTTETNNNRLVKIVDNGSTPTTYSTLAAAGANYAFRGVDLNTVPEPSSAALLGFGTLALLGLRRLNRKS
ncbi:MAG: PEP-CTERM sorting domain-containing protein [Betaproteobacteria bacterium]|nr:PEP-CTERM sorting domain-containing protein [Betaproteobacteria bacterium]